jgi:hypothetical protein
MQGFYFLERIGRSFSSNQPLIPDFVVFNVCLHAPQGYVIFDLCLHAPQGYSPEGRGGL